MKRFAFATVLALFLSGFVTLHTASAQGSANGRYHFLLEDQRLAKFTEFDAKTDEKGNASGFMTFTDDAKTVDPDVDGTGEPVDEAVPFSMSVAFDNMTVVKNQAVMNGVIRDSTHRAYVGRWVQLVVEDNGLNNLERPDQLAWRVCRVEATGWIPSDSEVKDDDGAFRSWWATDAERRDDVGIPSRNLMPGQTRTCPIYTITTHAYAGVTRYDGDIVVR